MEDRLDADSYGTGRLTARDLLVALVLTGLVWFDFWDGALPALPGPGPLAVGVGGGAALAVGLVVLNARGAFGALPESDVPFLVGLAVAAGVGLLVLPRELPVAVETGLVAFAWTGPVARAVAARDW